MTKVIKILPTDWEVLKTDAIDLDSDFVWFDDNLFETERMVLERNYVLVGFLKMNPQSPRNGKKALDFLKNLKNKKRKRRENGEKNGGSVKNTAE